MELKLNLLGLYIKNLHKNRTQLVKNKLQDLRYHSLCDALPQILTENVALFAVCNPCTEGIQYCLPIYLIPSSGSACSNSILSEPLDILFSPVGDVLEFL